VSGPVLITFVNDFQVNVDSFTVSNGSSRGTYTRARIDIDEPGFRLQFGREDLLASLGKIFGAQDVELGDPEFDSQLVVKSNQPNLARAWLRGAARHTVLRQQALTFVIEDGKVTATVGAHLTERPALDVLVQSAAAFAGGGRALRDRWAEAAVVFGGKLVAPWVVELHVPRGLVRIAADAAHERTLVTLERLGAPPREWTIDEIEPDPRAWRATIDAMAAPVGPAGEPYR
jgi:hypothetical protein